MRNVMWLVSAFVLSASSLAAHATTYTGSGIDDGGTATVIMGGSWGDFRGTGATSREASVVITSAPASIKYDKLHLMTSAIDFSATKRYQVGNTLETKAITCTVHINPTALDYKTPYSSPLTYVGGTDFQTNFPTETDYPALKQHGTGSLTIAGPTSKVTRSFTFDLSGASNMPFSVLDTVDLPLFAKLSGPDLERYGANGSAFSGVVDGVSVDVGFQALLVHGEWLSVPVSSVPEPSLAAGAIACGGLAILRRRPRAAV